MASRREEVIRAVQSLVASALPLSEVKRNVEAPDRPFAGGVVIVRDGDPGEAEVTMSPLTYTYSHAIRLEVIAVASAETRSAVLDAMLMSIGQAVEADRTLGQLCEWLEPSQADAGDATAPGGQPVRWAELDIVAVYSTANPLT